MSSCGGEADRLLAGLSEDDLLARIVPSMPSGPAVVIGPGDDAAVLAAPDGRVVATTDSMVRNLDWRDDWSTATDVGHKIVVQNLADIEAMGARPTGLLVALAAGPDTSAHWVQELSAAIAERAAEAEVAVLGGDLSGAPDGVVIVSVTALGSLDGRAAVTRAGAQPGDVLAVCGALGRSGGGLTLLSARGGAGPWDLAEEALVAVHRRPRLPSGAGAQAALAGAHAMIDISDGLVRDSLRVARASGVDVQLSRAALQEDLDALAALGDDGALAAVLGGGEEHCLLAAFVPGQAPRNWRVIGQVVATTSTPQVLMDGLPLPVTGWDHFAR